MVHQSLFHLVTQQEATEFGLSLYYYRILAYQHFTRKKKISSLVYQNLTTNSWCWLVCFLEAKRYQDLKPSGGRPLGNWMSCMSILSLSLSLVYLGNILSVSETGMYNLTRKKNKNLPCLSKSDSKPSGHDGMLVLFLAADIRSWDPHQVLRPSSGGGPLGNGMSCTDPAALFNGRLVACCLWSSVQ